MKKRLFFILFVLLSITLMGTSIGWGNLQWPDAISIVQGETTENIYGQVWMGGVTDSPGQGAGITAQLGYGADGSTADSTWAWFTATYFGDAGGGNNDEYVYNLVCDMAAGNYDYTYRYHYTGDADYYYAGNSGDLTVTAAPPDTFSVTFQVDMQEQTVSGDGVHIAGSFQSWDPSATELTDPDSNDVYSVTIELISATYQYKFVNGDEWGEDESVPGECAVGGNRQVTTPEADTTLAAVCYGECDVCTFAETYDVTFQVDMQNETVSENGVHVAGSFQGWDPSATELTDPDFDEVYSVTLEIEAGTYQYKFVNGNAWGDDETVPGECAVDNNRSVTTPEADTTLSVVCFGECGECTPLTNQDVTVTFQVYMGELDPAWYQGGVSVQGNIDSLDWNAGSNLLSDPDTDMIYTGNVLIPAGTSPNGEYKFTRNDSARAWYWEDCNNRTFIVDDSDSTQVIDLDYWNDVLPAPENVVVEVSGSDVVISWDAVAGSPVYDVYRDSDPYGSFETKINTEDIHSTTFTDEGAASETKYFYRVKAKN